MRVTCASHAHHGANPCATDEAPLGMRVLYRSAYVAELTTNVAPAYVGSTSNGIYVAVATSPMP